jgi:hypothetical protein
MDPFGFDLRGEDPVETMSRCLKAAREEWSGLVTLRSEPHNAGSNEGTMRFIYKPCKIVPNETDGTVEVQTSCIEYTIDTYRSKEGDELHDDDSRTRFGEAMSLDVEEKCGLDDIDSESQFGGATSLVIYEKRSLYDINDYNLKTQSLKEGAICMSKEATSLSAAGTRVPMSWLRSDEQELCPALQFC